MNNSVLRKKLYIIILLAVLTVLSVSTVSCTQKSQESIKASENIQQQDNVAEAQVIISKRLNEYENEEAAIEDIANGIVFNERKRAGAESIQEWLDTTLTEGAGQLSEWYVLGLLQSGYVCDYSGYKDALEAYMQEKEVKNPVTMLKYRLILMLIDKGSNDGMIKGQTEGLAVEEEQWNNTTLENAGIMECVYYLHLLNNDCPEDGISVTDVLDKIFGLRLADGGWAVSGKTADVDVTAMVLQALAPYYHQKHFEMNGEYYDDIRTAVDDGVSLLSEGQLNDGDYMSYGKSNPESVSQVIIALSALDIDCLSDERFIKNENTLFDGLMKYMLPDYGFSHTEGEAENHISTVQSFCAMISLWRQKNGMPGLYMQTGKADDSVLSDIYFEAVVKEDTSANGGNSQITDVGGEQRDSAPYSYKRTVIIIILSVMSAAFIFLWLSGKRRIKSYIGVCGLAALLVATVILTDIQGVEEYYRLAVPDEITGTVAFSIRCDTIADRAVNKYIPEDGVIFTEDALDIMEGDTVLTVLNRIVKQNKLHADITGGSGMEYIRGINYLYEFDYGNLSGWVYMVNGEMPSISCGSCVLASGDEVELLYTCSSGDDLRERQGK